MRKLFGAAVLLAAVLTLGSCSDGLVHGTDGLEKYGKENLGGYDLIGTASGSWETVAWYSLIAGETEYVYAVRFRIKGNDTWEYIGAELGHRCGVGLYEIYADHGHFFCVNNENCKKIMLLTGDKTQNQYVTEYPFVTYMEINYEPETEYSGDMVTTGSYSSSYYFFDKDNNLIAGYEPDIIVYNNE